MLIYNQKETERTNSEGEEHDRLFIDKWQSREHEEKGKTEVQEVWGTAVEICEAWHCESCTSDVRVHRVSESTCRYGVVGWLRGIIEQNDRTCDWRTKEGDTVKELKSYDINKIDMITAKEDKIYICF